MPVFTADDGQEYRLKIDAPKIRDIRSECEIDIVNLEGREYERLAEDPVLLVDVLWCLCRDEAKAAGITATAFGESLVGDAIEDATKAFLEALADFFPTRKRSLLRSLVSKTEALQNQGIAAAQKRLDDPKLAAELSTAIEAAVDREMTNLSTRLTSVTDWRESSDSKPAV